MAIIPIFSMLAGIPNLLFNPGLYPVYLKYIPSLLKKDRNIVVELINAGLIFIILGSILSLFIFIFLAEKLSFFIFNTYNYVFAIKILSIGIFFKNYQQFFTSILWATSRFGQKSIIITVDTISRVLLTISFYLLWGIKGLIWGLVLNSFISMILSLFFIRDFIFNNNFKIYPINALLKDSLPFYLESYLHYFKNQGDRWIVTSFLGPESLAIYFIALRAYEILTSQIDIILQVMTTTLSKMKDNLKHYLKKIEELYLLETFILIPIVAFFVGLIPIFIKIIAGHNYYSAIIPSILLCIGIIYKIYTYPLYNTVLIFFPSKYRFKITLLETVILLLFLFVLGKLFKITGIAIARSLPLMFTGIYAYKFISKKMKIKFWNRNVIVVLFLSLFISISLLIFQFYIFNVYWFIVVFIISIVFYFLIINLTISEKYYNVINVISPIRISDPFKILKKYLE